MTVRPVAPRVGSLVLLHLTLAVLSLVIEALSVGQVSSDVPESVVCQLMESSGWCCRL